MGLCLGAARKLSYWTRIPGKLRAPSRIFKTALKLFILCLLSSGLPLDRHSVVLFPLTMNKPAYAALRRALIFAVREPRTFPLMRLNQRVLSSSGRVSHPKG
jgi:hypothetical protein